jgi:hypothetical protein
MLKVVRATAFGHSTEESNDVDYVQVTSRSGVRLVVRESREGDLLVEAPRTVLEVSARGVKVRC